MQWVTLAKELVLRGSSDVVGICKVGKKFHAVIARLARD
jgi:hypothetical protein